MRSALCFEACTNGAVAFVPSEVVLHVVQVEDLGPRRGGMLIKISSAGLFLPPDS